MKSDNIFLCVDSKFYYVILFLPVVHSDFCISA